MMEKNELKKILYRVKPLAHLLYIRKGKVYYSCVVNDIHMSFEVPVEDMGDADYFPTMNAHLLIRYLQ